MSKGTAAFSMQFSHYGHMPTNVEHAVLQQLGIVV